MFDYKDLGSPPTRTALEEDPGAASATARGNGIGLTVVASILDAVGWQIRVVERPERIRIEVRIPSTTTVGVSPR